MKSGDAGDGHGSGEDSGVVEGGCSSGGGWYELFLSGAYMRSIDTATVPTVSTTPEANTMATYTFCGLTCSGLGTRGFLSSSSLSEEVLMRAP